jgi:hypothetical protein
MTGSGGGIVQDTDPGALIGGSAGSGGSSSGGSFFSQRRPRPGYRPGPQSFGPRAFDRPWMGSGVPPMWPRYPGDGEGGTINIVQVQAQQQAAVQAELADHAQAVEGGMPPALADMALATNLQARAGLSPADAAAVTSQATSHAASLEPSKAISPWLLAALALGAVVVVRVATQKKKGSRSR